MEMGLSLANYQHHLTEVRELAPAADLKKRPQHQTYGAAVNYLTYWNLLNHIVNRYVLAVLHQFVITILVNGIKKTIQAITIA